MAIHQKKRATSWSDKEDAILNQHYLALGPNGIANLLPKRTITAIKCRAKMLGVCGFEPTSNKADIQTKQAEKEIIVGELKFLIPLICKQDKEKEREAMTLLSHAENNSIDWWWSFRDRRLGHLAEIFVRGYSYKSIQVTRDAFLERSGVFFEKEYGENSLSV
jgi:hypothetical protein